MGVPPRDDLWKNLHRKPLFLPWTMRVSCNFSRKPIQWNIDKHICCGWMFCSCSPLPFDISKTIPCSYGQPQGTDIMQVPKRANSCRQWIYPLISMAVNLWGKWFWNHTNLNGKIGCMDRGVLLGLQMVWYQAATLHALQVRRQIVAWDIFLVVSSVQILSSLG